MYPYRRLFIPHFQDIYEKPHRKFRREISKNRDPFFQHLPKTPSLGVDSRGSLGIAEEAEASAAEPEGGWERCRWLDF